MEKIYNLQTQLLVNITTIDALNEKIERMVLVTPQDIENLEDLYEKEFLLHMTHSGIYEDLLNYLDAEPRTEENELELARIEKSAFDMCRVESISL